MVAKMRCRQAEERLGEYLDGRLQGAARAGLEAHVRACRGCAQELEGFRVARAKVQSLAPAPLPEGFVEKVSAAARHQAAAGLKPVPAGRGPTLRWLAPALGLLVISLVAWWQMPRESTVRSLKSVSLESGVREQGPGARGQGSGPARSGAGGLRVEGKPEGVGVPAAKAKTSKAAIPPPAAVAAPPARPESTVAGPALPEALPQRVKSRRAEAPPPGPNLVIPTPGTEARSADRQVTANAAGERPQQEPFVPRRVRERAAFGSQDRLSGPPKIVSPETALAEDELRQPIDLRANAEIGPGGRPVVVFRIAGRPSGGPLSLQVAPGSNGDRKGERHEWEIGPSPAETSAIQGSGRAGVFGVTVGRKASTLPRGLDRVLPGYAAGAARKAAEPLASAGAQEKYRLFLPAQARRGDTSLSVEYRNLSTEKALADLSARAGLVIVAPAPLQGRVNLVLPNTSADEALRKIASENGFRVETDGLARNLVPEREKVENRE